MVQERNIGTCVVLSIVTCGIYAIYWYYCILTDLYAANNEINTATRDILLTIVTCGIYGIYMSYKVGTLINSARLRHGLPSKDDFVLYLILSIFGLQIVVYILAQNEINTSLAYVVNNNIFNNNSRSGFDVDAPYTPQDSKDTYGYRSDDDNGQ